MFHRHRWEPVAVQHGKAWFLERSLGDSTLVLYRCNRPRNDGEVCHEMTTRILHGHWQLEDVR